MSSVNLEMEHEFDEKINYGLDAPGLVKWFIFGGLLAIAVGVLSQVLSLPANLSETLSGFTWPGVWFFITGCLMIWSSYFGKFRARDKLIGALNLRGNETLLDLGCGRGLLLIGGAKALPNGKAIGIDLWSQTDLSNNSKNAVLTNARLEGVAKKIEIVDGDMCKLPMANNSIDIITASMSIHNIPSKEGRALAIREAVRVLKPGGRVALLDFKSTAEYEKSLRDCGFGNVRRSAISFWNFPPSRTVFGEKPFVAN